MLMMGLVPNWLVAEKLLDLGEEVVLLIIVVRFDKLEPSLRISNEVSLVGILHMRSLEVDGIEATNDGIMQKRHVSGACGEEIGLQD
jgi:hypothetical protein